MNTRVIYINGIRIPHDFAISIAERRGANSDTAKIIFDKKKLAGLELGDGQWVSMDEFYSGRLQAKFEWVQDKENPNKGTDESEETVTFICTRCPSELKR